MKIKHRYVFGKSEKTNEILEFLNQKAITYKISSGITLISFEIFEHDSLWSEIEKVMESYEIKPFTDVIYSKKELDDAKWLRIRAKWRAEYPQPEDSFTYERITYDASNYCSDCGCGLIQKGEFLLNKTPAWGKRNFLMLHWIEDELFITEDVARKLNASDMAGLHIKGVKSVKSQQALQNVFQIYIENYLKEGVILDKDEIAKDLKCTVCGSNKRVATGRNVLKIKQDVLLEDFDIVKTSDKFGDGHVCMSLILISNKMYNFIKENSWDKDLYFEPIMIKA